MLFAHVCMLFAHCRNKVVTQASQIQVQQEAQQQVQVQRHGPLQPPWPGELLQGQQLAQQEEQEVQPVQRQGPHQSQLGR